MSDSKKTVEALLDKSLDDRDPIRLLKNLRSRVGYRDGYYIPVTMEDIERIGDVIAWHESIRLGTQR